MQLNDVHLASSIDSYKSITTCIYLFIYPSIHSFIAVIVVIILHLYCKLCSQCSYVVVLDSEETGALKNIVSLKHIGGAAQYNTLSWGPQFLAMPLAGPILITVTYTWYTWPFSLLASLPLQQDLPSSLHGSVHTSLCLSKASVKMLKIFKNGKQ